MLKFLAGLVVGAVGVGLFSLPPDALAMALGVLFGVVAGLPVALLLVASQRRQGLDISDARKRTQPDIHLGNLISWRVVD